MAENATSTKTTKKKADPRVRTLSESEIEKKAQHLAESVLDAKFTETEIKISDLCVAYSCSKSLAEKIYIKAVPKLIAGNKMRALVDDELSVKNDLPYINNKGTLIIPTEALKKLANFDELKSKKTKFEMAVEDDGTITLTPVS